MVSSKHLASALPTAQYHNWVDRDIRAITRDSREVQPGDIYVAIPGVSVDGHAFATRARQAGAIAFVVERQLPELADAAVAVVPNSREALAYLHAAWQGYPARKLRVIGVTGTDGKTTTTRLVTSVLQAAGRLTGTVDSVSASIAGTEVPTGFHTTTPDAPEVQAYLREMVDAGVEYAIIESTSHGLAQFRVAGCEYDVAVVTNITHEHLDYHGSYEAYREAKAMLFRYLSISVAKPGCAKAAVLNADDSSYEYLCSISTDIQLAYGLGEDVDVRATDVRSSPAGLAFTVTTPDAVFAIESPLIGRYNVHNILAAIAVGHSQGIEPLHMAEGIAAVHGVPGRMQQIDCGQPFSVIIDFAHTPNALEHALRTARDLTDGQVIVVFGCAGLRDRAKRPWMGEIAGRLADKTIITAEDPRTESLDTIMAQIAAGSLRAGAVESESFWCIGDRGEALYAATRMAQPGDVVIATGKGHEQSLCFGTVEYPWSDQKAAIEALQRLGYQENEG